MVRKKFIRNLFLEGRDAEALWYTEREKIKVRMTLEKNPRLLKEWMVLNPKPGNPNEKSFIPNPLPPREKLSLRGDYPESKDANPLLTKIREAKQKIKDEISTQVVDRTRALMLAEAMKRLVQDEKKLVYEHNFYEFDAEMFSDLQDRVETPWFHIEMFDLFQKSPRVCVVCPRSHAKSTNARKYILHQILHGKVQYVLIVGASEDMAAQNLGWIRDQLTDNEKIIEVYGNLKDPTKWAETVFRTNTGVRVVAKGAGQKVRGQNERGRPDLIYVDDLEDDEQVDSKDQRDKLEKWFTHALMPVKSRRGRVIVTGTILHIDSLLKNISDNKVRDAYHWQVLFYQALTIDPITNEEKALWPQMYSVETLRSIRAADPEMFAQEYQNSPVSGGLKVFDPADYRYIGDEDIKINDMTGVVLIKGRPVHLMLTTDYALSSSASADWNVLMVTGMDDQTNLYVIDIVRYRTADPYETVENIFELFCKRYISMDYMTSEKIVLQKVLRRMLEHEMQMRGRHWYIKELGRQDSQKLLRIKSLKAPLRKGKVWWKHEHRQIEIEMDGVTTSSLGRYDDTLDCLADAWDNQIECIPEIRRDGPPVNSIEWLEQNGYMKPLDEIIEENYEKERW